MVQELVHMSTELNLEVIGICGDASRDEHKARALVLKANPHLLIADCWAHQIQLILGDYISANADIADTIDQAVMVVKWFLSHLYALGIFNEEQKEIPGSKPLSLIIPVITRWTAHYCSVIRLLKVKKPMTVAVVKHEDEFIDSVGKKKSARENASKVMDFVKDASFWKKLEQFV